MTTAEILASFPVASITIMKRGTGSASPEEVLLADEAWPPKRS